MPMGDNKLTAEEKRLEEMRTQEKPTGGAGGPT